MDRRDFLKMSSVAAFSAVCAWTGVSKVFSQSSDGKGQSVRGDMEHRNLGGLDVSAIGVFPWWATMVDGMKRRI